jgi:molybdate transport system ATP-binding protein
MNDAVLRVDVVKQYGTFELAVTFDCHPGTLVLFGASGSGKTTVLGSIAGLVRPEAGVITLHQRTLFRAGRDGAPVNLPARERRVGYVQQEYALFPHMSVLDNVAFPIRGVPRETREARARELIARVHMEAYCDVRPDALSGGQRQRVAVARALALGGGVLLLDEPFAALDDALRTRLQEEVRTLQRELGLVVLLVTHRIEDAFAMGDRIAVLHEGRIEQIGAVEDVFRRPASTRVAAAMGITNLIRGRLVQREGTYRLDWDGVELEVDADERLHDGAAVLAYVRPEDIRIVYPDRPPSSAVSRNVLRGSIVARRQLPGTRVVRVRLANAHELELRFPLLSYAGLDLEAGRDVVVSIRREGVVLLSVE